MTSKMKEYIKTTLYEYGLPEMDAQAATDEIMDELYNKLAE